IISPQKNNDSQVGSTPVIEDYEHDHMLRGDINSPWGIAISSSDEVVEAAATFIHSYKMILDDEWDSENCMVVAFVYDAGTYEVLQVMEEHVH
ncbi:MAG: Omp28-related outer membrane protein, partial [Bacteroidales bacterium]|nr:Omp28-related outer membrane protein [Bacteroidales bacterium]